MTCNCIAEHCKEAAANDDGLCDACHLCHELGGDCAAPSKGEPADLGSGAAREPIRPIDQERTAADVQKAAEDAIG
jgi:hypothetical protein